MEPKLLSARLRGEDQKTLVSLFSFSQAPQQAKRHSLYFKLIRRSLLCMAGERMLQLCYIHKFCIFAGIILKPFIHELIQ